MGYTVSPDLAKFSLTPCLMVELIRSPFFVNEVYGFPGCMSIDKSPHDIVGFFSKAKMERS